MRTQNSMKRMFAVVFALFALLATASADWTTYDASTLPGDAGFNVKNSAGADAILTLVDDADNSGNKILQFISGSADKNTLEAPKFDSKVSGGGTKQAFTVVMRARAYKFSADSVYKNFMEVEVKDGEIRDKVRFYPEKGLDIEKANSKELKAYPDGHDSYAFNIYRVTFKEGITTVYINDVMVDQSVAASTTSSDSDSRFVIGDSNSSADYGIEYDWIIWDNGDAYAPGQGADYPAGLIISPLTAGEVGDGNWNIYAADETPQNFGFSESSDLYSGETAVPMADPDNAGNNILDFSTIDTTKSKYSFNQSLNIDSTKGFTVIMRAKAKSVDHDLVEVTLKSGFSYEKIRFYPDKGELNVEKGTADTRKVSYPVPDGVDMLDWNVYRFSIVDSVLNMWVNEIQVGFDIKTTYESTTTTNFGFGEGNSGMTYASYIDWVIWDETGAYGPGEGSDFPSSLVISPLTGGEVVVPDYMRFSEINVPVGSAAGSVEIEVDANAAWSVSSSDSWITSISPLSGDSGVTVVTVSYEEHTAAAPRIATISGYIGFDVMDEVTITQEGKAVLIAATGASASSAQVKDGVTKAATNAIDGDNTTSWVPSEGIVNGEHEWVKVAVAPNSEVVLVKITEYKNSQRLTAFSVDYWNGTEYVETLPLQLSPLQAVDNSEVAYALPSAINTDTVMFKFYGNAGTTETDPSTASGWLTVTELSVWGAETSSAINEMSIMDYSVYPNPSAGVFTIDNAQGADIRIVSLAGQVLYEKSNIAVQEVIDVDLSSGIYLLNVDDTVSKIVVR